MATAGSRLDYGLDAPGLARGFFIAGSVAAIIATAMRLVDFGWPIAAALLALVAVYGLGMGSLMVVWSRVIKVRTRETLLDAIDWRGDEVVLDVGCGRGLMLVGAAKRLSSGQAIGIDIWQATDQSANGPAGAIANARAEGVATHVDVRTADMRTLPFADAAFDVVVSHWAVHNLGDAAQRETALGEMVRVLRPAGTIILADIAHRDVYVETLARLGLGSQRVIAPAWRDALLGAVSFGSFRPGAIIARRATPSARRPAKAENAGLPPG